MRDQIIWKPVRMPTEKHGERTVYVKHWFVPHVGALAAHDTAFSVPAFVRVKGRRVTGFVTPRDGMAFQQENNGPWFVAHTKQGDVS